MKKEGNLVYELNILKKMVKNFETVEERIRNAITPMYNLAEIIKDIQNNKNAEILKEYLFYNLDIDVVFKNIDYIINIGHEVDKALPKDYSINEHLNREND